MELSAINILKVNHTAKFVSAIVSRSRDHRFLLWSNHERVNKIKKLFIGNAFKE